MSNNSVLGYLQYTPQWLQTTCNHRGTYLVSGWIAIQAVQSFGVFAIILSSAEPKKPPGGEFDFGTTLLVLDGGTDDWLLEVAGRHDGVY